MAYSLQHFGSSSLFWGDRHALHGTEHVKGVPGCRAARTGKFILVPPDADLLHLRAAWLALRTVLWDDGTMDRSGVANEKKPKPGGPFVTVPAKTNPRSHRPDLSSLMAGYGRLKIATCTTNPLPSLSFSVRSLSGTRQTLKDLRNTSSHC